jgi:hypothetical protein
MQYSIDTLGIEISRLQKTIRDMKSYIPSPDQDPIIQSRVLEFENQIRELKKAIGVLREYTKNSSQNSVYSSRLADPSLR